MHVGDFCSRSLHEHHNQQLSSAAAEPEIGIRVLMNEMNTTSTVFASKMCIFVVQQSDSNRVGVYKSQVFFSKFVTSQEVLNTIFNAEATTGNST